MKNPFQCNLSGDWFFFDETEDVNGPYDTEEEAKAALDEYVFWWSLIMNAVNGGCKPYRTTQMKDKGVDWVNYAGGWYMVCDICVGNCGQCGLTGYVDNVPFDMQRLANKLVENQVGYNYMFKERK